MQLLLEKGYLNFADAVLKERECAQLPPYSHLAMLRAEATKQVRPMDFLQAVKTRMQKNDVKVLGPVPSLMEKKAGKFRAQLMLQSRQRNNLHQALQQLTDNIADIPEAKNVRWTLDVDPQEV